MAHAEAGHESGVLLPAAVKPGPARADLGADASHRRGPEHHDTKADERGPGHGGCSHAIKRRSAHKVVGGGGQSLYWCIVIQKHRQGGPALPKNFTPF